MERDKFNQVVSMVRQDLPNTSINEISEFVNADWREPEHQQWLETASAEEISDWVIAGLK